MSKSFMKGLVCILAPLLLVSGCTSQPVMGGAGYALMRYFEDPGVNLMEKNYAAADYMNQQVSNFVRPGDGIKAVPLQDINEPALSTAIGRVVARQTGERYRQLGYDIDITETSPPAQSNVPHAAKAVESNPEYILSGTYYRANRGVDIKLRMVQAGTGRIVGEFDYRLPYTNEIRKLTSPKPQIYKTGP